MNDLFTSRREALGLCLRPSNNWQRRSTGYFFKTLWYYGSGDVAYLRFEANDYLELLQAGSSIGGANFTIQYTKNAEDI